MSCTAHMRHLNLPGDDIEVSRRGISSQWTIENRSTKFYKDGSNIELTKAQFNRVVSALTRAFDDRPGPNGMQSNSWRPIRGKLNVGESSIDVMSSSYSFEEIEQRITRAIRTALR